MEEERPQPRAGEIWNAVLGPIRGSEQDGLRPVLVISNDWFNEYNARMVVIAPITRTHRGIRYQVEVGAGEGGLPADSTVMSDQMRSIDRIRLKKKLGTVSDSILVDVRKRVVAIITDQLPLHERS